MKYIRLAYATKVNGKEHGVNDVVHTDEATASNLIYLGLARKSRKPQVVKHNTKPVETEQRKDDK